VDPAPVAMPSAAPALAPAASSGGDPDKPPEVAVGPRRSASAPAAKTAKLDSPDWQALVGSPAGAPARSADAPAAAPKKAVKKALPGSGL
jgi:hypothetical protein